jgi:hypothetical protein
MNENTTLVAELRSWIEKYKDRLASDAVQITNKLPKVQDNEQSKGCVGLSRGHITMLFASLPSGNYV